MPITKARGDVENRRPRRLVVVPALAVAAAVVSGCATPGAESSTKTNSLDARAQASQLIQGTLNAIGIVEASPTPVFNESCGGDGLPHGPDIMVTQEVIATMPPGQDINQVMDEAMAYWRKLGLSDVGPFNDGDQTLPPDHWSLIDATAYDQATGGGAEIQAWGNGTVRIAAKSGCVYPVGTDNPSNRSTP